jgi:hypothetical protein
MVRRSDVNLVKVDRAPPGEPVLLPEANEDPTALLSKTASQNLSRYSGATAAAQNAAQTPVSTIHVTGGENRKPVVRQAVRRFADSQNQRQQLQTQQARSQQAIAQAQAQPQPAASANGLGLPEPLPDEPVTSWRQKLVPLAIATTGSLAIASGIYLYVQGQALWEKARLQATQTGEAAEPVAEQPTAVEPPAGNEIVQAPSIAPDAPIRTTAPVRAVIEAPAKAVAVAALVPSPARADMIDEVHANAMAPSRTAPASAASAQIQVELLTDTAHIHSGPGMKYPVIGTADNKRKYAVEEWRDRWFKIKLESPAPAKTAWIRNDMVRLSP